MIKFGAVSFNKSSKYGFKWPAMLSFNGNSLLFQQKNSYYTPIKDANDIRLNTLKDNPGAKKKVDINYCPKKNIIFLIVFSLLPKENLTCFTHLIHVMK